MSYKEFLGLLTPMINPKSNQQSKGTLSFAGNGKVSVSVNTILNSDRAKEQIQAVRDIAKIIDVAPTPKK